MDRPRQVAIEAAPAEVRPALRTLWDIDLAFANIHSTNITPRLGEIRLAWWRERLEELDRGVEPPAEPRLQAVAEYLIPAGITGFDLSRLEDPWLVLLNPYPWGEAEADALAERGAILFELSARLLDQEAAESRPLGVAWSLADAARRVTDPLSRATLQDRAKSAIAALPQRRMSSELAPLIMITFRRVYDLLYGDRPGWHRVLAALRYLFSGRMPR